jgi:hypothetical protein
MPIVITLAGILLIFTGSKLGWGLTWVLAGVFFISIGVSAILISLAWIVPGPLGAILKHPVVSVLIIAEVLISMCATVVVGVIRGGH